MRDGTSDRFNVAGGSDLAVVIVVVVVLVGKVVGVLEGLGWLY